MNIPGIDQIGDSLFQNGMMSDARNLGDNFVGSGSDSKPDWDDAFLQEIHGVGLITGNDRVTADKKLADVKAILSGTVTEISTIVGDVRPDDQKGHEQ
jgi:hypothetical protein